MPKTIGYARVSTEDQRTLRQVDELRAAGCTEVLEERASGGDRSRPVLAALLRRLGRDDTLVVAKLDRLARSLEHLLEVVRTLEARGAFLWVLGDPIHTATPQGRFMLQMLGAVAEFERALIRERVVSGLARAAREGRRGGNPAMRARDPDALRRLWHAREDAYLAQVSAGADNWLPLVTKLRIEEGRTWDEVVRTVNLRLSSKTPQEPSWTEARLVRAVRALVRDGLVSGEVLQTRGKRKTVAVRERDAALRTVAAMGGENPGVTLQAIGERLSALQMYPARGGIHWSASSVAYLVKVARKAGLIP